MQILVRTGKRGLSEAVLDGLRRARGEILVCMDADLSHPPEVIPEILRALEDGADFVIGSRYIAGGTTADDWGVLRWINSRIATLLARPLTSVRDPMAGLFALRRSTFESGRDFNPVGYKIGLELIVKCGCRRVVEVPIHFEDRRFGDSKLTLTQQLLYLQHLGRLYVFRYGPAGRARFKEAERESPPTRPGQAAGESEARAGQPALQDSILRAAQDGRGADRPGHGR